MDKKYKKSKKLVIGIAGIIPLRPSFILIDEINAVPKLNLCNKNFNIFLCL